MNERNEEFLGAWNMRILLELPNKIVAPLLQKHLDTGVPVKDMIEKILEDHAVIELMVSEGDSIYAVRKSSARGYKSYSGFELVYEGNTDTLQVSRARQKPVKNEDDDD